MTNTPKHTPAPWGLSEFNTYGSRGVVDANLNKVADVYVGRGDKKIDRAHLIVAAPEMLEALEQVEHGLRAFLNENPRFLGETHGTTTMGIHLNKLKSAIAKAKGRA